MPCKNTKLVVRFVLITYMGAAVAPLLHLLLHAEPISLADCEVVDREGPSFLAPCENPNHHHGDHHDEHQCQICRAAKMAQAVVLLPNHSESVCPGIVIALPSVLTLEGMNHHAVRARAPPLSCNS